MAKKSNKKKQKSKQKQQADGGSVGGSIVDPPPSDAASSQQQQQQQQPVIVPEWEDAPIITTDTMNNTSTSNIAAAIELGVGGPAFLDTIPENESVAAARIANLSTASAVASSSSSSDDDNDGTSKDVVAGDDDEEQGGVKKKRKKKTKRQQGGSATSDVADFGRMSSSPEQPQQPKPFCTKRKWIFYTLLGIVLIAIGVGIYFVVVAAHNNNNNNNEEDEANNPDDIQDSNITIGGSNPDEDLSNDATEGDATGGVDGIDGIPTPSPVYEKGSTFPPVDFEFLIDSDMPSSAPSFNDEDRNEIDQILLDVSDQGNGNLIYDPNTDQGICRDIMISSSASYTVSEVGGARIRQRYILCVLYYCTYSPTSLWSIDWTIPNECEWYGIACSDAFGQNKEVVVIELAEYDLVGKIPYELTKLESLQAMTFYGNDMTGTIPSGLLTMPNLIECNLGNNQLVGQIAAGQQATTTTTSSLEILKLYGNNFDGHVPLYQFPNLRRLRIQENQFTSISFRNNPNDAVQYPQLTDLVIYNNMIQGQIPSNVYWPSMMPNLINLDIANNLFTGNLPSSIFEFPKLQALVAYGCLFSGPIGLSSVDHQATTTQSALEHVWVHDNLLSGQVPQYLGWNWVNLTSYLIYDNTQLFGSIDESLCGRWTKKEQISTDCNNFDPCFCCANGPSGESCNS